MEPVTCQLCKLRVSNWMMASGKCLIVNGKLVHKACVVDHKLKTGKEYQ